MTNISTSNLGDLNTSIIDLGDYNYIRYTTSDDPTIWAEVHNHEDNIHMAEVDIYSNGRRQAVHLINFDDVVDHIHFALAALLS